MKSRLLNLIATLLFIIGLSASAYGQDVLKPASSADRQTEPTQGTEQNKAQRPILQHRNPRYQVLKDDVLTISFPLAPELNQKVTIQPDGYVTVQNLGSIYIQGMTVPEIEDALKKASVNILHD